MSRTSESFGEYLSALPLPQRLKQDTADAYEAIASNEELVSWLITKEGARPEIEFLPRQYYALDVNKKWGAIEDCFRRIEEATFLIGRYPNTKLMRGFGITHGRWMEYHLSLFFSCVASIGDTSLHLVNSIFELGVLPRNCSEKTITQNEIVSTTPVGSALTNLDSVLQPYKRIRNLDLHRSERPDVGKLIGKEHLYGVLTILTTEHVLNSASEIAAYRLMIRDSKTRVMKEMVLIADEVLPPIEELQASLLPTFKAKYVSKITLAEQFEKMKEKAKELDESQHNPKDEAAN